MADINTPVEIGVTTGPIRGSRKVHVGARTGSGVRNDGKPQASDTAPGLRAASIAISLMADRRICATVEDT